MREALAAEYALGTLQGRARRRFEHVLKGDPALRAYVTAWQARLHPLGETIAPVVPPKRVWQAIATRIQGRRPGLWQSLLFWRWLSASSAAALVLVAVYAGVWLPRLEAGKEYMVVVMSDQQSRPMITVSWPMQDRKKTKLRIRVIGHQDMAPNTAWELWMLAGEDRKPHSLGLITTHETQEVEIPAHLLPAINAAWGMAMSVEPHGGSPTGAPSGPVLYSGQCTRI
ncbi:MAG: anti-sigma factor domain-containing protein [Burkholderiales bacterium]